VQSGPGRWGWKAALNVVHGRPAGVPPSSCTGRIYHYVYRIYAPQDSNYERCVGMSWCTVCREVADGLVFVSRDTVLWDALADLPEHVRDRLARSSRKIRDHLDRIVRGGLWPEDAPTGTPGRRAQTDRK
jgi:hypothetical protein